MMDVQVMEPARVQAMVASEKAQIDTQIATAKAYPRDLALAQRNVLTTIKDDEEIAASCFYKIPKGDGIQGPSVRLAELCVYEFGNIQIQVRTVEVAERTVTCEAMARDLEKNTTYRAECSRSIWGNRGRFNDDMITTTIQAASAIAYRNAVFKIIPGAFVQKAYELAMKTAVGNAKGTVAERAGESIKAFSKLGVTRDMIFAYVGHDDVTNFTADDLTDLRGIYNAIKNDGASVESYFDVKNAKGKKEEKAKNMEEFKAKAKNKSDDLPGTESGHVDRG